MSVFSRNLWGWSDSKGLLSRAPSQKISPFLAQLHILLGAGGIGTHEGLRHRISPEPDLKSSTHLYPSRGMSCPFGLIPAHEIGLQRHYCSMGLGNPRAPSKNLNIRSAIKKRRGGLSSNCD